MSSTTYVCLENSGPKYDGNFAHIKSFNRKIEARLKGKNPLAAAIATGEIAVKATKTPLGKMYEHITGILTVTMLQLQTQLKQRTAFSQNSMAKRTPQSSKKILVFSARTPTTK